MAFKLPVLTYELDCEPIGYPGLVVSLCLNLCLDDYKYPWAGIEDKEKQAKERRKILDAEPWLSEFYYGLGRIVESVTFPEGMTDTGEAEVLQVPDAKTLYDLLNTPGFDQSIITWATSQYTKHSQDRLKAEAKN